MSHERKSKIVLPHRGMAASGLTFIKESFPLPWVSDFPWDGNFDFFLIFRWVPNIVMECWLLQNAFWFMVKFLSFSLVCVSSFCFGYVIIIIIMGVGWCISLSNQLNNYFKDICLSNQLNNVRVMHLFVQSLCSRTWTKECYYFSIIITTILNVEACRIVICKVSKLSWFCLLEACMACWLVVFSLSSCGGL